MAKGTATWKRVRLGDIVERHVQRVRDVSGYSRFVGVDHLDSEDLRLRRHGVMGVDEIPPTFRFVFGEGTVLVPTRRPRLRKCAVAPFEGLTGEKILVLKPIARGDLHPGFVPHLLASPAVQNWNIEKEIGSVTPHFRWADMAEYEFALPPLEEQRRIGRSCESSQQMVMAWNDAVQRARIVRLSYAMKVFSDPNGTRATIGSCIAQSSYGPRFDGGLYDEQGSLAQLRTTDIDEDGNIDYATIPRVRAEPGALSVHILQPGDLVISRSGTCGLTAVFEGHALPTVAAAFLVRLRTNDELRPRYLHEYLSSPVGRALSQSLARGGVQKNINASELLVQNFTVPPLAAQDKVVTFLSNTRTCEQAAVRRLKAARDLAHDLMTKLLEHGS